MATRGYLLEWHQFQAYCAESKLRTMNMMPLTLLLRTKVFQRFKRCLPFVCALMAAATSVFGEDWGMGASNAKLSHPDVFAPVSTPAYAIDTLAWFAIAICTGIALVVGGLLAYSIVRFRAPPER